VTLEFNAVNIRLAFIEDAILNDKVDQLLAQHSISDMITDKFESSGLNSEIDKAQITKTISHLLKSEEFKAVFRTTKFQSIYEVTPLLPPLSFGGLELINHVFLKKIETTEAWKNFLSLEDAQEIEQRVKFSSLLKYMLFSEMTAHACSQNVIPLAQDILIPKEGPEWVQYNYYGAVSSETILDFKICDRTFGLDLRLFSVHNIKSHLKEYLVNSNYKYKIIHDTITLSRELTQGDFIKHNEARFILFCLTSLYDFIYEKACALFNYIIEQQQNNTLLYQSLVVDKISAYLSSEQLFLFYISAGSKVNEMRNFYNNNFAAIWRSYVTTLSAEKRQQSTKGLEKNLREKLAKSLYPAESPNLPPAPVADACPNKQKFPYKKNLLGALAWKKAEKTGRPFIDVFREAAEEWLDEDGNEITGEQLANNFYNSAKNHGGPQYFYDAKEKQLTIIKKKIKWKD